MPLPQKGSSPASNRSAAGGLGGKDIPAKAWGVVAVEYRRCVSRGLGTMKSVFWQASLDRSIDWWCVVFQGWLECLGCLCNGLRSASQRASRTRRSVDPTSPTNKDTTRTASTELQARHPRRQHAMFSSGVSKSHPKLPGWQHELEDDGQIDCKSCYVTCGFYVLCPTYYESSEAMQVAGNAQLGPLILTAELVHRDFARLNELSINT